MANSCCFFMPLRYGAAAMATLEFLLSAVLAIALWVEVSKWTGYDVGIRLTGVTAAAATYYTILSFSALVGSLAIFVRNRGVLRYFAFCLGWSLGLQLAVSALQLWGYLSTPRSSIVAECASKRGDQEACLGAFALSIGWLITSIVVGLLVQLCSAYVVSSYSTKLSEEDSLTASAPIPHTKSVSRRASRASIATTIVAHPEGKEKQWDNEKGTGGDDDDAEGDGLRLDPGPPQVPMLDPAPPRRIPRVRPQYPQGLGPGSADAAILSAASKARSSRPGSGRSSPHATSADASVISTPTAVPAPKPQPSSDLFSDRPRPSFESDSTLVLPTDPAMMV